MTTPLAAVLPESLLPGDPVPHFVRQSQSGRRSVWSTLAGRYVVFCFHGSAADPAGRRAVDAAIRHRDRFDDRRASFYGVSYDRGDETAAGLQDSLPGLRFLQDFDGTASRLCGALPKSPAADQPLRYRQFWMVVDPTLHVLAVFPFSPTDPDHAAVFAYLDQLPAPEHFAGAELPAPILILPNVFEPELCRHLIGLYDADGGSESGVMRNGVGVFDNAMKRRRDYVVDDPGLLEVIGARVSRRVIPEIRRVFFMQVTRMERYLVGCYAAEDGGHFRPHRDNDQPITAHRRFAVSINLNADFEGGEVRFPEYSPRGYRAPPGWAVVFPCPALHMVSPVTRGRRYAFLPFVYDEEGARIRQANMAQASAAQAIAAQAGAAPAG